MRSPAQCDQRVADPIGARVAQGTDQQAGDFAARQKAQLAQPPPHRALQAHSPDARALSQRQVIQCSHTNSSYPCSTVCAPRRGGERHL